MLKQFIAYIIMTLLFASASAQVPDSQLDRDQYPANNQADTKREAIFATYFAEANVSNTHYYVPQGDVSADYLYKGTELPRGLFGIFEQEWRSTMPDDFKAYAVTAIRGEGKPYYVLRFSGEGTDEMIGLFEIVNDILYHKATLASYWCENIYCQQKDSWLQDFDGNVRLDILTKVKFTDKRRDDQVIEEYYTILKQQKDGKFVKDSQMDVDVNDYFMESFQ
jgi:hypothetical protein